VSRLGRAFAPIWAFGVLAVVSPLSAQQVVEIPARDQALTARPTDVFRVGKIEGASWELYGRRVETAFDGSGNLHIFDPENFRVVVVSPTGTFLREVGKRGDGPGELRQPSGFAVLRDGTVIVADLGQRSFLVYDATGAFQRSVTFATGNVVTLGALLADPRGGAVVSSGRRIFMMQATPGSGAPAMPTGRPIVRFPLAAGSESRQIHSAWEPPAVAPQTRAVGAGGRATIAFGGAMARAFEPGLFAGVMPDGGIALSDSSAYAIKIVGADGGIRSVFRRPIRPQAVNSRIQQAEKERRLADLASGRGPQIRIQADGPGGGGGRGGGGAVPSQADIDQMLRNNVEQLQFYPEVPVITGLATGWAGKIWVARRDNDDIYGDGPVDVLGPTGQYIGTIVSGMKVPSAFGPNGLAAFVETDALDVVTVAVRRLPTELR
jgi:hypothetical protein